MNSYFPDVNVWFALAVKEHVHHQSAVDWWESCPGDIAFCRLTQIGLLRLLTTPAAMNSRPLSMQQAWAAYDRIVGDARVRWQGEPGTIEAAFRLGTSLPHAASKIWTDAYLQAFAETAGATLVTLDRALANRTPGCLLLAG